MLRISAVQFRVLKDPRANIAKAERFIKDESKKSDLIVFPEYFLGSGSRDSEGILDRFKSLAERHRIDIVLGSIQTERGGQRYNTSHYIDYRGRLLARYDKATPWKSEAVAAGRFPEPFKTRFGKTAIIICWDLANPSISSHLSRQDVDLIVCPAMWWEGSEAGSGTRFAGDFIDALCLTRAYECRAAVVYSNAAGSLKLSSFSDLSAGRSQLIIPLMAPKRARGRGEQAVRGAFDLQSLVKGKGYLGSV